jgi:asparagine synthase (glutamine-hydrolysing)
MQEELSQVALELRNRVICAVRETMGDSIVLSGGLDTSIIVAIVSSVLKLSDKVRAYTITLEDAPSPDLQYSKLVSNRFGLSHRLDSITFAELDKELPQVIRVLRSFDPMEIRNSIVAYIGMKKAKSEGCSKIMTGDASDELFAGYSFIFKEPKEKAKRTLAHLWEVMHFSSIPLAKSLGMDAKIPFLHPRLVEFAIREIDFDLLVGRNGNEIFGKYILRRAFEDLLSPEITWRVKTPIEYGSGTTLLPKIYSQVIGDNEFIDKRKRYLENDGVRLRDKEQLRYYEIFREIFGSPTTQNRNQRSCPACKSNVPGNATFCTTCGEYPI